MILAATTARCPHCGERDGTELWCPSGGLGIVHGLGVYWCRRCVLTVQLAEARRLAAAIPELERRLAVEGGEVAV